MDRFLSTGWNFDIILSIFVKTPYKIIHMKTVKTILFVLSVMLIPVLASAQATDIFFSEYIEGGSNRKALEIYNGTGGPINLDNYRIAQSSNGNGWQYYFYFPTGAVLANGAVWVMITDQIDNSFFNNSLANQILTFPDLVFFNGNDARAIEKTYDAGATWTIIDVFGDPNSAANFNVAGVTGAAVNKTLVRKPNVCSPNANWALSAGTDTASSEWLVYPQDNFSFLGSHTANCQASSIPGIMINEFLADNVSAYIDPSDNSYDDWIELYNPTSQPVNMLNWSMTDNRNNPLKWVFPDTIIPAGGYLLVWADEDASDPGLHAAFKLSKSGEEIFLYHSTGQRVDSIIFGPQHTDTTYARIPNGSGPFVFAPPTPMAMNFGFPPVLMDTIPPVALNAWAIDALNVYVAFSEPVGPSAEMTIHYTGLPSISGIIRSAGLDTAKILLSTPLAAGTPYTLTISGIADTAGNVMTSTYPFVIGFGSANHPIVLTEIMYNPPEAGTDTLEFLEFYHNGSSPIDMGGFVISKGVVFTFPSMIVQPGAYVLVAVNASAMMNTFGVNALQWTSGGLSNSGEEIELKDALGNVVDYVNFSDASPWPTSPDGSGPSLTLCDPSTDNSLATNWTASTEYAAVNAAGDTIWATPGAGCFVPVILTADFSASQVNVLTGDSIAFTDLSIGNPTSWEWSFPGAVPSSSTSQNPSGIVYPNPGQYDVTLIVHNAAGEHDTLLRPAYIQVSPSWYPDIVITEIMYNPPESGTDTLEFLELYNNDNQAVNLQGWHFSKGITHTFPSLILQPGEYLVLAAFPNAVSNFFGIPAIAWTSGGLSNSGEEIELKDAFGYVIDYVNFDDVAPWPVSPDGFGPSLSLCDPASDNSLAANWSASTWFAGINGAGDSVLATPGHPCIPAILPVAGFVASQTSIIADGTVDFTDLSAYNPQTWNWSFPGAVPSSSTDRNPMGIMYPTPGNFDVRLIVTNPTGSDTLFMTGLIQVLPPPVPHIVITEIMYNPPEAGTDTLEFIELYNNDVTTVNLEGYYFSKGIVYIFPALSLAPGQYFLLAVDSLKFTQFYGKPARQWTSGALSNSGEELELKDKYGSVVDYVNFDDAAPWPTSPDGFGPSLSLCDPSADNSLASNWSAATEFVGYVNAIAVYASPGAGCTFVYSITGQLNYATPASFPLGGANLGLFGPSGFLKSTTSNMLGAYGFDNILDGTYGIHPSTTLPWQGVNATDALLVLKHFIGMQVLNGIHAEAADVNADGAVNAADAMFVLKRFVGLSNSFQAGDWLFENPAIVVNGNDVIHNIKGICVGDVDASYGVKKSGGVATSGEGLPMTPGMLVKIPIRSSEHLSISALSLEMTWPDVLQISHIEGPEGLLEFSQQDEILKMGWVSLRPTMLDAGDVVCYIHAYLGTTKEDAIMLSTGVQNIEAADEMGGIIKDAGFIFPELIPISHNLPLWPNPADRIVSLTIPADAQLAEIKILDMTGRLVHTAKPLTIGNEYALDLNNIEPGVYLITLFDGKSHHTARLVISR